MHVAPPGLTLPLQCSVHSDSLQSLLHSQNESRTCRADAHGLWYPQRGRELALWSKRRCTPAASGPGGDPTPCASSDSTNERPSVLDGELRDSEWTPGRRRDLRQDGKRHNLGSDATQSVWRPTATMRPLASGQTPPSDLCSGWPSNHALPYSFAQLLKVLYVCERCPYPNNALAKCTQFPNCNARTLGWIQPSTKTLGAYEDLVSVIRLVTQN